MVRNRLRNYPLHPRRRRGRRRFQMLEVADAPNPLILNLLKDDPEPVAGLPSLHPRQFPRQLRRGRRLFQMFQVADAFAGVAGYPCRIP